MSIAHFIDHTILKQTTILADIDRVCEEAVQYGFAAVCIPPLYVQHAALKLRETAIKVATVIGFPFGYTYISAKTTEADQALMDGADELDTVMNVAAFKNGDYTYLENEITAILELAKKGGKGVKVIIESGILSPHEIIRCCALYKAFDINFLKTSTGYAEKGATVEAVQLMRRHLPSYIGIKASGGIKDYSFAADLLNAGATRLGCSAGVAIITGSTGDTGY